MLLVWLLLAFDAYENYALVEFLTTEKKNLGIRGSQKAYNTKTSFWTVEPQAHYRCVG